MADTSVLPEIYDDAGRLLYKLPEPGKANLPSTLVFSLPKAGSVMLYGAVAKMCAHAGVTYVDFPSFLFTKGVPIGRIGDFSPAMKEFGYCYGGFRRFPSGLDIQFIDSCKKIFFVRDPRDMLVSAYYSIVNSHPVPGNDMGEDVREAFLKKREAAIAQSIDDYVVNASQNYIELIKNYRHLLDMNNILTLRYEDFIYKKENLLHELNAYLEWELDSVALHKIAHTMDIIPEYENISSHVRQVHPGNHKVKLKLKTIDKLNTIFSDLLTELKYDEDPMWVRPALPQSLRQQEPV